MIYNTLMKTVRFSFCLFLFAGLFLPAAYAQKTKSPGNCNMYLEGNVVKEVTLEDALKWIELTPPTIKCDDGKIYGIETMMISFFTLKPLQNQDFGLGEGGFPVRAREAIAKGNPGDAIVMKDITVLNEKGERITIPVISIKLKEKSVK